MYQKSLGPTICAFASKAEKFRAIWCEVEGYLFALRCAGRIHLVFWGMKVLFFPVVISISCFVGVAFFSRSYPAHKCTLTFVNSEVRGWSDPGTSGD